MMDRGVIRRSGEGGEDEVGEGSDVLLAGWQGGSGKALTGREG